MRKQETLFVLAVDGKDVREIDTATGKPLMDIRTVGKVNGEVIKAGVMLNYHSHYVARLKEGMLLPMDSRTAMLAGVALPTEIKRK